MNGKNAYIGKGSIRLETGLRRGNDFLILNMRLLATTTITTEGGYQICRLYIFYLLFIDYDDSCLLLLIKKKKFHHDELLLLSTVGGPTLHLSFYPLTRTTNLSRTALIGLFPTACTETPSHQRQSTPSWIFTTPHQVVKKKTSGLPHISKMPKQRTPRRS